MLKKVNIEDIEVSGYDCYSASLAVIGNYLNAEYQLMSIGIWCFEYKYGFSNKLIGNAVKPYIRRNNVNIENLCGVKINSYKLRESFSFDEIVEYINQGIPIIIKGDLYDCPWTVAYLVYNGHIRPTARSNWTTLPLI